MIHIQQLNSSLEDIRHPSGPCKVDTEGIQAIIGKQALQTADLLI